MKSLKKLTKLTPAERAALILRNHSPSFNVAIPTEEACARSRSISPRAIDERSQ